MSMEFKWILWSMAIILALLFFSSLLLSAKAKKRSQLEANYYQRLLAYQKNPSSAQRSQVELLGAALGENRRLSKKAIQLMLEEDLRLFS